MKIAIGTSLQEGPWGGGNQAMKALVTFLEENGWKVLYDLKDPGLDVIMLTDPRTELRSVAFGPREIFQYLKWKNPRARVIHRVNECDERKGTTGLNDLLRRANICADATVFVSRWLEDLHVAQGWPQGFPRHVILNGSDSDLFSPGSPWDGSHPVRLVTHHWGNSWNKGFDVYRDIDEALGSREWQNRIEFTYLGNLPEGFRFKNATHISPLAGPDLAEELRRHHIYVTASINEPGSNHQNEGILSGLPVLFREQGSMKEYCRGFGVGFQGLDWKSSLENLLTEYKRHRSKISDFPFTSSKMANEYEKIFRNVVKPVGRGGRWEVWRRWWKWRHHE